MNILYSQSHECRFIKLGVILSTPTVLSSVAQSRAHHLIPDQTVKNMKSGFMVLPHLPKNDTKVFRTKSSDTACFPRLWD